jgi:phosphopantothenoylcysteine decarboxylase / phosphopantothenate---cysteine ligase
MTILLGVTGGIAAYKACDLVRLLVKDGHDVHVMMTEAATRFVSPLTFETLSLNRVGTSLWDKAEADRIEHTETGREADLIVVAPATANFIGRVAAGLADDLLTTTVMASRAPVLLFPSMNEAMYANPIVQDNLTRLAAMDRYHVIDPDAGELACQVVGKGRLPAPADMLAWIQRALGGGRLAGRRVLVSAGATRAPIDDVRFISNPSTGRMGFALARAAWLAGAEVTLVTGPTLLPTPTGVRRVEVSGVQQMGQALEDELVAADMLFMTAAVGDFELEQPWRGKLKKGDHAAGLTLALRRGPDLLTSLARDKGARILVGFAAEAHDHDRQARAKLASKGVDFVFMNPVEAAGAGFASPDNHGTLYAADGRATRFDPCAKETLALRIIEAVLDQTEGA